MSDQKPRWVESTKKIQGIPVSPTPPTTGQVLTYDGTQWEPADSAGGGVDPHASTHQNGGADEISVTGLSGLLADPQTPVTHASSHQDGGADELSVSGLSGLLADAQTVEVADEGTLVGTRKRINFTGGGVTAVDNAGQNRVDVTVSGGGTVTGTGAADRVAVWSSSSALTSEADFTYQLSTNTVRVSSTGGYFEVGGGATTRALLEVGTLTVDPGFYFAQSGSSAVSPAVQINVISTGSGSGGATAAHFILQSGYTGTGTTTSISVENNVAGQTNNTGIKVISAGSGSGSTYRGVHSVAGNGSESNNVCIGVDSVTGTGGGGDATSTYIGIAGRGNGAGDVNIGGWFSNIENVEPTTETVSAGIIVNSSITSPSPIPIAIFRANNEEVCSIQYDGHIKVQTITATTLSKGTLPVYLVIVNSATPAELTSGNGSFLPSLADNQTMMGVANIVVRGTAGTNNDKSAAYVLKFVVERTGSTTTLKNSALETLEEEDSAWDLTAEADDTNDRVAVKFTSDAASTVTISGWIDYSIAG